MSADSEHDRAVRNWGLLTAGDTFSILGGVFAYSSAAGAEALTIESGLALAGLAGGMLAGAAALPIVIALGIAIGTSDEATSHTLAEAAGPFGIAISPGTQFLLTVGSPGLLFTGGMKDPLYWYETAGAGVDFLTGTGGAAYSYFGLGHKGLEALRDAALATAGGATAVPGIIEGYQQNYPRQPAPGGLSPGLPAGPGTPWSGVSPAGGDPGFMFPFLPGTGDLGVGDAGSQSFDSLSFSMTPIGDGFGADAGGIQGTSVFSLGAGGVVPGPESGADPGPGPEPDPGGEPDPGPASNPGPSPEPDPGGDPGPGPGPDPGGPGPGPDPSPGPSPGPSPAPGPDPDPDPDSC